MSSARRSSAEAGFRSSSAALERAVTGDSTGFTQAERQASIGVSDDEGSDYDSDDENDPFARFNSSFVAPRRVGRNLFGGRRAPINLRQPAV